MFVYYCTLRIDPAQCAANQVLIDTHRTVVKAGIESALEAICALGED
jgi:hypothetical protein